MCMGGREGEDEEEGWGERVRKQTTEQVGETVNKR